MAGMKQRGRPPHPDILTPREWEVLRLLREELTNEQIAHQLGITLDGAKYHVSQILAKLGVSSREEAAEWRPEEDTRGRPRVPRLRRWALLPLGVKLTGATAAIVAVAALGLLAWSLVAVSAEPVSRDTILFNSFRLAAAGDETVFALELQESTYADGLEALSAQKGFTQSDRERTRRGMRMSGISPSDAAFIVHMLDTGRVTRLTAPAFEVCSDRVFLLDPMSGEALFAHSFEFPCPENTTSTLTDRDEAIRLASGYPDGPYCHVIKFDKADNTTDYSCLRSCCLFEVIDIASGSYEEMLDRLRELGYRPDSSLQSNGDSVWLVAVRSPRIDGLAAPGLIPASTLDRQLMPGCMETAKIVSIQTGQILANKSVAADGCHEILQRSIPPVRPADY